MQRAIYRPEDEGHYALASAATALHIAHPPYPDLTIHRLVDVRNRGKKPEQRMDQLLVLGDHCSEREQRAAEASASSRK